MSAGIIYILSLRAITFPAPLVSIDQLQHPALPLALSWGKMIPPPPRNTSQDARTQHTWSINRSFTKELAG